MGLKREKGTSGSTDITRDIVRLWRRHGAAIYGGLSQRLIVALAGEAVIS
jgi:hypothetical protein